MANFLKTLRHTRGRVSQLVRELLIILCQSCNVDDAATNVIAMWIRRVEPLTSDWYILAAKINPSQKTTEAIEEVFNSLDPTLFQQAHIGCRERPMEGTHSYPDYKKIIIEKWYILGLQIIPSETTINEMKLIIEKYGVPKNPSEKKWTYLDTNYKGLPSNSENIKLETRNRFKRIICAPVVESDKPPTEKRSKNVNHCDGPVVKPDKPPTKPTKKQSKKVVNRCDEPAFEPDEPPPTKNQTENEPAFEPDEPPPTKNQTENEPAFEPDEPPPTINQTENEPAFEPDEPPPTKNQTENEPAFEPDEPPPTINQTENEPAFEPDEPPPTKNQTENSDDFEEGCDEKFVTVIFPESTDTTPYKYPKKNLKKFKTQTLTKNLENKPTTFQTVLSLKTSTSAKEYILDIDTINVNDSESSDHSSSTMSIDTFSYNQSDSSSAIVSVPKNKKKTCT
ncbi:cell surface glycoprotein 1-like [Metopolophium dirhodum]|uniref:cell surface glycoprotein 1-like n=1 Tax=Metopolophium dirhodum TaxID=44670 RepID=UPI0029903C34|nr:cell surface glycoprotein 1-like [Metopolophium dirhodum]